MKVIYILNNLKKTNKLQISIHVFSIIYIILSFVNKRIYILNNLKKTFILQMEKYIGQMDN
jgi:hypothetical protein